MLEHLKYYFKYAVVFIRRKNKSILLFTLSLALVLGLFFFLIQKFDKKTITEGLVGTFREEDLPDSVTNLLSKSLITVDNSGTPQTNLLRNWEVNKELNEYKLQLKDNLVWNDGTKVKSSDVVIPIVDTDVKYPDDKTIIVKIKDSFSPFPTLLIKPILKKNTTVGLGEYTISNIQKDQIFIRKLILKPKNPKLNQIVIKFFPNERIAKTAFKLGEIEALLGANDLTDITDQKNTGIISRTNYTQLVTIFYNTKDQILSDENFRLALSFSAPSIKGEIEAKTSIPPTSWAFNPDVKDYLDNNIGAKAAFAKVTHGQDATITLTATQSLKDVGQKVVDEWNKLGVKAVLRIESGIPQHFQSLLIAQNIPVDPDQYSLWHSTQTQTNISQFTDSKSSPRIDKDLEDARKTVDQEIRKDRYKDFQKVLLDHAPATFLYFPKYNIIYRGKIQSEFAEIIKMQLPNLK